MPKQQRAPRARGEGPRSDAKDGEKKSWTMVDKNEKPKHTRAKKQE
jgi:hypothetical protein